MRRIFTVLISLLLAGLVGACTADTDSGGSSAPAPRVTAEEKVKENPDFIVNSHANTIVQDSEGTFWLLKRDKNGAGVRYRIPNTATEQCLNKRYTAGGTATAEITKAFTATKWPATCKT